MFRGLMYGSYRSPRELIWIFGMLIYLALMAEAKRRIGDRVCMIGGFDQFHFLKGCTPEETRREVRRCFEAAGAGGGYILSPSDHFFEADLPLLEAFADEARQCVY